VKISKIQIPLVMETWAFMRAVKKETTFAIYATSVMESVNGLVALLICYKDYQDVFEKKNANIIPQHHLYDYTIDLQDSTQPPFRPIYNLLQNKLVAL
jgi:hypothetical protein